MKPGGRPLQAISRSVGVPDPFYSQQKDKATLIPLNPYRTWPIHLYWFTWRNIFRFVSAETSRLKCCSAILSEWNEPKIHQELTATSTCGSAVYQRLPPATAPAFIIGGMMYETETASQQPINQLQNNDGHSGPKPYWLMTDAVWSDGGGGGGGQEHNRHLFFFLAAERTNLTSPMLTNGCQTAVTNAPRGGSVQTRVPGKSGFNCVTGANQPKQMEPSSHFCLITSPPMPNSQPE